ncbi:unnamed protein product, partial [Tetraodon nigroviridis]
MQRIRYKQEKYRAGREPSEESSEPDTAGGPDHSTPEAELVAPGDSRAEIRMEKKMRKSWVPWLDHATVLHAGDYYLFESESEDEEESQPEEQKPPKKTACQLAYQSWVSSVKTALRERQSLQRHLRTKKQEKDSHKGGGNSDESEDSDLQEEKQSVHGEMVQRILHLLHFLWAIVLAMVDGLTLWLNLLTKQYRETSVVLCNERYYTIHKIQQVRAPQQGSTSGANPPSSHRPGSALPGSVPHQRSQPMGTKLAEQPAARPTGSSRSPELGDSSMELLSVPSKQQRRCRTASELLDDSVSSIQELEESRAFFQGQNRLLRLLFAMYNLLAAHSEVACYFIMVLNNMVTASVISLVLPILVFLWAMLSVPRPTKRFWMTAIVYTEVMVVVKYVFQFGFFPWNSVYEMALNEDKPFFPPRILGLEKTDNYIRYDLLQLLALFFHRSLLMVSGRSHTALWPVGPRGAPRGAGSCSKDGPEAASAPEVTAGSPSGCLAAGVEDDTGDGVKRKSTFPRLRRKSQHPRGPSSGWFLLLRTREAVKLPPSREEEQSSSSLLRLHPEAAYANKVSARRRRKGIRREVGRQRLVAAGQKLKHVFVSGFNSVYQPAKVFFRSILHPEYRAATDVYALMFLTDVIDFIVIIFGFWAFGKHSAAADIASSLSEDQVPEAFLAMLLIQFSTMIIDRALYLRKAVLGKLIFQVILVFGIHLWMFFILPAVTERMFNQNFVAQLWYFVKCIYFGLSALQIRCGYPTRILGNFLTKKYNHLNLFLFQGFRLVPFLVELRAVMDWVWTDTTLSLSNWMCVEDIYANIFIIKCSRETEKKYPQPKGQKKKKIVKYGMGGLIIFFLICIIWFPLLFISLVRSVVGVVNHPIDVTVTIKLGGYEPLFTMSVQQQSIQPFTKAEYEQLTQKFHDSAVAMQFITLYNYEDIVTARIEGSSGSVWRISPPSRQEVIKELLTSPAHLTLRLAWNFQRDLGKGGTVEHSFDKHSVPLEPGNPVRAELASLLLGNRSEPAHVPHFFPNYLRAPNGAEAKPVSQLYQGGEEDYLNISLSLKSDRPQRSGVTQEWWDVAIEGASSSGVLPMVIFNDKVSPPSLGFLAGYGIMGLYVSVVLVIGKFVRGFFSEISHSIMFEELPCVDRILKLCTDIFLVRETGELELEEELYCKLIFLYRSPETMIKWTRDI